VTGAAATSAAGVLVDGGSCNAAGSWTGRIVLCTRGTVSFATMNTNVRAGGGVGLVVANNVAGSPAFTLGAGVSSPIPAIGITDVDAIGARAAAGSAATLDNVVRIGNGYELYSGTSMATPHVSGVAALIWGLQPGRTNAEVRQALTGSAIDLGNPGRDTSFGFGLVQAKAAYDYLLNPPPTPAVVLDKSTIAFGNQSVNLSSAATTVTVTSNGTAPATLAAALSGTNANQFVLVNNCGTTPLVPPATCTLTVSFRPTSSGNKVATLTVTPTGGTARTVTLTGTGIVGTLALSPTTTQGFGNLAVGSTSAAKAITLTNSSTTASVAMIPSGTVISFTGTNQTQFAQTNDCPAVLAPRGTCTISVVFKPTSTGSKSASLRVAPTGVTARTVALTGTGI